MLVRRAVGMGIAHGATVRFRAVLTELEFSQDSGDGNAKADDPGQHGATIAVRKMTPLFGVGRIIDLDQSGKERLLSRIVFDEFKGAICVDGDVIPRWHRKLFGVERGAYVTVRAGKDDQGFAIGERLPMGVGLGEMTFEDAVRALIVDNQR